MRQRGCDHPQTAQKQLKATQAVGVSGRSIEEAFGSV
jgi:hypothetical protein